MAGVVEEQQGRDRDRAGHGRAVGVGQRSRAPEREHEGENGYQQQPVDPRNIDLAHYLFRGVLDAQSRKVAEPRGLVRDREGAGNDRLRGDDGRYGGEEHHREPGPPRGQQEERVAGAGRVAQDQGALILGHPASTSNPFFLLAPGWARLPMVFLATVATVIASQAVITGAFSVAHQAARLGYLPRLRIQYTSEQIMGQIYIPWINWLLLVSVLTLVLAFRSSAALAYAYGTAVTGTITITTLLFFYYARHRWRTPLWIVLAGGGVLIAIDLLFLAANLTKLMHGAWLPLLIGITAFTILTTWQRGRELVTLQRVREEGPLPAFIDQLHAMKPPLHRVPGTAIFLNRGKATAPLALRANVEHNEILHEEVLILSIETMPAPHVPAEERLQIVDLGYKDDRIIHVTARFGYMDQTNVPGLMPLIRGAAIESPLHDDRLSYFVSRIELVQGNTPGMSRWRKRLFIATSRITADAAEYFGLPHERTVIMGSRIEL